MPVRVPRSRRAKWSAAAVLAVLALVGGLFLTFNTNTFGPEELCRGRLSADDVRRAFPGAGRLSDKDSEQDRSCTVERTAVGPGTSEVQFSLDVEPESGAFPFERGTWAMSGSGDIISGASSGTTGERGGWLLLPSSCAALADSAAPASRPVLRARVWSGTAEPDGLARLLATAAASLTAESNCRSNPGEAPGDVLPASAVSATDTAEVCSLPGFRLAKVTGPKGQSVQERTSGSLDSAWFCDLSFTGDERNGPFTRLAVVKDPELSVSLKDRRVEKAVCGGKETYFLLDNADYPWDPKERAATGFPSEKELSDLFGRAAREALDCS
ncbi:hypothetical protein [Streptomyces sp. NPDC127033]|uniref:hypothetical protein n=1 Tax=Streptomyces sp. NPDC127033 TaxID=3347110 RepID=UPI003666C930